MLFVINENLNIENLNNCSLSQKNSIEVNISQLAYSSLRGQIFLVINSGFIEVYKNLTIPQAFKEHLGNLNQKVSLVRNSIIDHVDFYISIGLFEDPITPSLQNNKLVIPIDIRDSSVGDIATAPDLLCEDENDYKAYIFITEYYQRKHKLRYKLISSFLNGGGQNIRRVLNSRLSSKKPCLCLYDSDISYKGGIKGSVAQSVESIISQTSNSFVNAKCFNDLREIENAIPPIMLGECINQNLEYINTCRNSIIDKCRFESWKYFDMKNGLKKAILNIRSDKEREYWYQIITNFDWKIDRDGYYIKGYGDEILARWNNYINNRKILYLNYKIDECLVDYWEDMGKTIYSWICAPAKSSL